MKRGTEDLDFFIGDEAIAASSGPGMLGPVDGRGYGLTGRQAMGYTIRFGTGRLRTGWVALERKWLDGG